MATVAKRQVFTVFAAAEPHLAPLLQGELHRCEVGTLVATVAEGLLLATPAGAEPVVTRLQLDDVWLLLRDMGF